MCSWKGKLLAVAMIAGISSLLTIIISRQFPGRCGGNVKQAAPAPAKTEPAAVDRERPVLVAKYTSVPVTIDGVLDEEVWKNAVVYPLRIKEPDEEKGKVTEEGGEVRLAWDDKNFYVAIKFTDSDIVAEGDEDQLHHYKMGDLAELFLKPENSTWYWELYVTPRSKKSSFFLPGRGRLWIDSNAAYTCGLKVAAQNHGTLNNWKDKDQYWTGEMAMPIKDLTAHGDKFGPGSEWTILVARYNYSRYLQGKEFSTAPQLGLVGRGFHSHEGYGKIKFEK